MPLDPFEPVVSHRPLDYWGRSLIDHLIRLLPEALADDGTAYVMQLSIIGERRTTRALDRAGLSARASSTSASFDFTELFTEAQRPDRARRGALRRLSPQARRDGCDGRLPNRDHPRGTRKVEAA